MKYLINKLMSSVEYSQLIKLIGDKIDLNNPDNFEIQKLLDRVLDTICAASMIVVKKS